MVKRMMITLGLICLLNIGETNAMENPNNPNPDAVNRIVGIIQNLGLQENTPETKDIILDALQGDMATDEEINQAFMKSGSEGKQMPQEQKRRELGATEKENAQKMMMINEALKRHEDSLIREGEEVKDVQSVIGQTLHEVSANPVLDGELVYEGAPKPFKIRNLVKKDGSIDLSDPIFGETSRFLLITTDPEQFFNIDEERRRLVVLIAPRFLIEEKIGSSAAPFQPIMANWKEDQAPIGIFYRSSDEKDLSKYDFITSANLISISKNNLHQNWATRPQPDDSTSLGTTWNAYVARDFTFILNKN